MAVGNSGVSLRARLTMATTSIGAVAIVAFVVIALGSRPSRTIPGQKDSAALRQEALNKINGLPLYFEANEGQVDSSVRYLARRGRYSLFLTDDAAVFSIIGGEWHKGRLEASLPISMQRETHLTESAVRVRMIGANANPEVEGLEPLPGRVNYLIGNQKNWHRDIPTFGRVRFHNVYPGVDVVYYGTPDRLEYDFIAAPGADASKIKFAIEGPAKTTQTASGDIVIATDSGVIRIGKPQNYQHNADGSRTSINGSFKLQKDGTVVAGIPTREAGFNIAGYDRSKPLFIDPTVATVPYSTYFGGNASSVGPLNLEQFSSFLGKASLMDSETGVDVALDSSANAYITGAAYSNNLPTADFFQSTLEGAFSPPDQNPNVYIAKFDTSLSGASSLKYATYVGANGNTKTAGTGDGDLGFGIAVDGDADAYVVGQTYSGNALDSPSDPFPGTSSCGAWGQSNIGFHRDTNQGFVSELAAGGDSLVYSCYIPGANNATAARVALVPGCESNCDTYIVGTTQSTSGTPVTATGPDGFVVTSNAKQSQLATGEGGLSNAFFMVVAGGGSASAPVYSSYYGGTSNSSEGDLGLAVSAESATEAAITGAAFSSNIPLSADPAQGTFLGGTSTSMAYVAIFNPMGATSTSSFSYGSYLGGSGSDNTLLGVAIGDVGTAIVLDGSDVWVAGLTASTNFPVQGVSGVSTSKPPYQASNQPHANVGSPATTGFITELEPSSTAGLGQVVYSTYFGGTGQSIEGLFGLGDAIGAMTEHAGKVYVTGLTTSATGGASGFPNSSNACKTTNTSGGIDFDGFTVPVTAFVSALDTTQSTAANQLDFSSLLGGSGEADIGLGIAYDSVGNDIYVVGSTYSTDFSPITSNAYQVANTDFNEADSFQSTSAFLTEINPVGDTCPTPFATPTPTPTATGATATPTPTGSVTRTASPTITFVITPSATSSSTSTRTATPSVTITISPSPSPTPSSTASSSSTPTRTITPSVTTTITPSPTVTPTTTRTATPTPTPTITTTPSPTPTPGVGTLSFKPTLVNFGDKTKMGKTKTEKLTIKNTSSKSSKIEVMVTSESASPMPPFGVKTQCMKTLKPGKTCKVEVTFTPTDTDGHMGNLTVMDDAQGNPQTVQLMGTGAQ